MLALSGPLLVILTNRGFNFAELGVSVAPPRTPLPPGEHQRSCSGENRWHVARLSAPPDNPLPDSRNVNFI